MPVTIGTTEFVEARWWTHREILHAAPTRTTSGFISKIVRYAGAHLAARSILAQWFCQ